MAQLDLQRRGMYLPRREKRRPPSQLRETTMRHSSPLTAPRAERDRQSDRDETRVGPVRNRRPPLGSLHPVTGRGGFPR